MSTHGDRELGELEPMPKPREKTALKLPNFKRKAPAAFNFMFFFVLKLPIKSLILQPTGVLRAAFKVEPLLKKSLREGLKDQACLTSLHKTL